MNHKNEASWTGFFAGVLAALIIGFFGGIGFDLGASLFDGAL